MPKKPSTPEERAAKAAYMRAWLARKREQDPEYVKAYHKRAYDRRTSTPEKKAAHVAAQVEAQRIRRAADPEAANAKSRVNMAKIRAKRRATGQGNAVEIAWAKRNRETINAKRRARYAQDPEYQLRCTLRARLQAALKAKNTRKVERVYELVGCTIPELMDKLAALFEPGMSWGNYGSWHVDHRKPVASFDLSDPVQLRACFHHSNLQPLWKLDNYRKGGRLIESEPFEQHPI